MDENQPADSALMHEVQQLRRRVRELESQLEQDDLSQADVDLTDDALGPVFAGSPDAILLADPETGEILAANEAAAELWGRPCEELVGMHQRDLHPPDLFDVSHDTFKLHGELGDDLGVVDMDILHADGQRIPVEITGHLIEIGARKVQMGFFRDATRRHAVEQALRDRENSLRVMLDAIPESAFLMEPDGTVVQANTEVAHRLGTKRELFLGHSMYDFVPPDVAERRRPHVDRALQTRAVQEFVDTRFGRVIRNIVAPVMGKDGQVTHLAILGIDETDRHEAEAELQRSEREKSLILGTISEMIAYYGDDQRILWTNRASGESVGGAPEDLIGRYCHEVWHGRDEPCEGCPVMKVRETGRPCEGRITVPNGHSYDIRAYPVHDAGGQVVGVVEIGQDVTERLRTEQALEASERRFRAVFDNAGMGIALGTTDDATIEQANQALARILGYSQEELVGMKVEEFSHPDDMRQDFQLMQELLEGERDGYSLEKRYFHKDGRTIWGRVSVTLIREPPNASPHFVGLLEDITQRKRAEEALKRSQQRYAMATRAGKTAVWEWDVEADELHHEPEYWEWLGYTQQEADQRPNLWREVIHPDDVAVVSAQARAHLAGDVDEYICQHRVIRKDGREIWVEARGRVVGDNDRARRMVGTVTDVTQRKRAEDELHEALLRQDKAIEAGNIGLWDWDLRTNNVRYSREWKAQIGYAEDEIGDDFEEWQSRVHPDDLPRVVERIQEHIRTRDQKYQVEFRFRHKDGTYRWILAQASVFLNDAGEPYRVMGSHVDVTEQKRIEAELRESEERFRIIIENLPGGVFAHDLDGNLVLVNRAACANTGYSRDELLGMRVADIDPESVAREDRKRSWEGLRYGDVERIEGKHRRKDGSIYLADIRLNPVTLKGNPIILAIAQDITELKQAEDEVRDREERFRYIMKYNPDAIAVYDKDLRYIMVSDRYLDDYGIQDRDIIGRHHYEVFPEVPERWRAVHRRVLGGVVERAEVDSFVRPDGSVTYNRWECRPWYDSDGQVGGMITYTEVITDRIEAQRAIEAQRRLFFDVLEAIPAFVYLQAPDYTIRFANRRFRDRFGEPGSRPCYELVADRDTPCETCRTFKAFEADQTVEWEWQARDGTTYMIYDTPMQDVDGSPLVLEIGIDISGRKQAEQALRESEGRVRAKLDAILLPEGDIGSLDLADILDVEAVQALMDDFYAMTGYGVGVLDIEGNVLVAKGWQDICTKFHRVHPDTCKNCIDSDTRLSAGTQPGAVKIYRCKNNMWDMATPIILGERHLGNVFLGQFFFTDEEVNVEAFREQARRYGFDEAEYLAALNRVPRWSREEIHRVMHFYAGLARLIGTLGYSNIKLARTLTEQKRAEERIRQDAETRAVLLREVNHRVKNNLSAIIGMLYSEQRRRHDEGQPGEATLGTLIGRIRSLSTVHGMLSASEWQPVPLCDLARQIIGTTIRSLSQDRQVAVDVPQANIPVSADQAHHLAPILSELATNSLKHCEGDTPLGIRVAVERRGEDVRLIYRDDGTGFSDRVLSLEPAAAGVGLDLIVNIVSKNLRGTVTLRNDGGALVEILFPINPEPTP